MALDKNGLLSLVATNKPDNTTGLITPEKSREVDQQIITANANLEELNQQTFKGPIHFDENPTGVGLDNVVEVNKLSDIVTAPETRITFRADTKYEFGNTTRIDTDLEADMQHGTVLEGPSQLTEVYRYTGTGTAFTSLGAGYYLRNFGFSVPDGTIFDALNPLPIVLESVRCFECDEVGTISGVAGVAAINIFDSVFLNIKTQGLITPGAFLIIAIREVFIATTAVGVNLIDWTGSALNDLEITNLEAQAPAGSFVLAGDAGSVNIDAGRVANIRDSSLSTKILGNALGGGLLASDAGYQYDSATVINSKTIGHCYVTTPVTTVINPAVEVPVAGVYTEGGASSQTSCAANGFITTNNRIEKHANISVDLDIDKAGGGADDYIFRAKKIPFGSVVEDIDGVFKTITLSGGGSASITFSGPTTIDDGDQFYISVEGQSTDDIDARTSNFKVFE